MIIYENNEDVHSTKKTEPKIILIPLKTFLSLFLHPTVLFFRLYVQKFVTNGYRYRKNKKSSRQLIQASWKETRSASHCHSM